MIKPYWKITLDIYDIMEKEGDVSQFREWWNVLPVSLFKKRIQKLRDLIIEKLNDNFGNDESVKIEDAKWQLESLNNINGIKANYMGLLYVLKIQPQLNSLKQFYQKYTRKRLRIRNNKQFGMYSQGIKKYTGIDVKTFDDIEKVRKLLEFKTDKYNENYPPIKQEGAKIYLMGFAMGVYSKLNIPFDPTRVTIIQFLEARNKALEIKDKKSDK